jgi:protein MpaA
VIHYMVCMINNKLISQITIILILGKVVYSIQTEVKKEYVYKEHIIGYSVENRPIYLIEIGSGKEITLILGVIHGDEPQGKYIIERLKEYLKKNMSILKNKKVLLIPVANPDGFIKKTRVNARGVDLNRNFPTKDWGTIRKKKRYNPGQRKPEPETQAIIKVIELYKPDKIIAIHSYHRYCNNYDGPAKKLAETMQKYNKYPVKSYIGYPTPGSLGTYAGKERKIPTITLELPNNISIEKSWLQNKDALIAAIKFDINK